MENERTYTAFALHRRLTTGPLRQVLLESKALLDAGKHDAILFFEDDTGKQVDFDFRGTPEEVIARAIPTTLPGPGRPKLGVVSREVSLLPRHWEWLEQQPAGISAAIRRLVEEARKHEPEKERARLAIEATSRVMTVLAGNRRGFEEVTRALFAQDRARFDALLERWPEDIKNHLRWLVRDAMPASESRKLIAKSETPPNSARRARKKRDRS